MPRSYNSVKYVIQMSPVWLLVAYWLSVHALPNRFLRTGFFVAVAVLFSASATRTFDPVSLAFFGRDETEPRTMLCMNSRVRPPDEKHCGNDEMIYNLQPEVPSLAAVFVAPASLDRQRVERRADTAGDLERRRGEEELPRRRRRRTPPPARRGRTSRRASGPCRGCRAGAPAVACAGSSNGITSTAFVSVATAATSRACSHSTQAIPRPGIWRM